MFEYLREDIEEKMRELEEEQQIGFPDEKSREEFTEDLIDLIEYKWQYYNNGNGYSINYETEILDLAEQYGYIKEEG